MRNADKQSKPIGGELLIHTWDTKFCDHRTKAPLTRALEIINGKITKIELAWEVFKQTQSEGQPLKRVRIILGINPHSPGTTTN